MTYTLIGRYPLGDLTGREGEHLRFVPSTTIVGDGNIVLPAPVPVTLDSDGAFSIELVGTDDPDYAPTGWVWTVIEMMDGGRPPWSFELTANADISDLTATVDPADYSLTVPATRQVIAGAGMSGGGTLEADRTLSVVYGTTAGTATQGNDSRLGGLPFNVKSYGAVGNGSTDDSAAITAAIAAAYAAGGGTVYFPAGTYRVLSQLVIPNDGETVPRQPAITLRGAGAMWDGQWQAGVGDLVGCTVLDLQATTAPAKIDTRGTGALTVECLTLTQTGSLTDTTPFIRTTNTTLFVRDCSFYGHHNLVRRTCVQDAIHLGAAYETVGAGGGVNMPFQGYGTVIERNYFARITTGVLGSTWANGVVIRDNTWSNSCGGGTGSSAIWFDGTVGFNSGNVITGNLMEQRGYDYTIRLTNSQQNFLMGNSFYDGDASYPLAIHRIDGTAVRCRDNLIQGSYVDDTISTRLLVDATTGGPAPGTAHIVNGTIRGNGLNEYRIQPAKLRVMPYDVIGNDTEAVLVVSRGQQEAANSGESLLSVAHNGLILAGGSWSTHAAVKIINSPGSTTYDHESIVRGGGSFLLYPGTGTTDAVVIGRGVFTLPKKTTVARPSAADAGAGSCYYDTTMSRPVWSDGSRWRDSADGLAYTPAAPGQWYGNPFMTAVRTLVPTLNRAYFYPMFSGPTGVTIDRMDVTTTIAGSAGAVARFGLWLIDNQQDPFRWASGTQWATLLYDGGTLATDDAAAQHVKVLGAAQSIPANTWFAVGVAHQVATAATCNVTGSAGSARWTPLGNATAVGGAVASPGLALYQDTVTGAFGAMVPNGCINVDGGAGIKRSA